MISTLSTRTVQYMCVFIHLVLSSKRSWAVTMEISRDSFDDRNKQVLVFFSYHPQHHRQRTQAERTHGEWLWRFLIVALSLTIGTGAMPQNPHQSTPCPSASWAWRGPAWPSVESPWSARYGVSNPIRTEDVCERHVWNKCVAYGHDLKFRTP